jgi:hypothetical protein
MLESLFNLKNYKEILMKKFYGRLSIICLININKKGKYVLCKCKCGKAKIVYYSNLKRGDSQSCGCLNIERIKRITKHGGSNSPIYQNWHHLKERCNKKTLKNYKNYGGRGITYDKKWDNFLNFKKDMWFKYIWAKKKFPNEILSIEREDVNGNYCFDNCIFIPRRKQLENTRKNKWFIATNLKTGKQIREKNIRAFAREHNIDNSAIAKSLKRIMYHKVGEWKFKYCG